MSMSMSVTGSAIFTGRRQCRGHEATIASSLQSFHLGIIEAACAPGGGVGPAEGLNLEVRFAGKSDGQVAESDGLAERVAVPRAGRRADNLARIEDGFASVERCPSVDREGAQPARHTLTLDLVQR